MLILRYFDWTGTREELMEFARDVKDLCDRSEDIECLGLYGPGQVKWN